MQLIRVLGAAALAALSIVLLAAQSGEIGKVGAPPPEQPIPYSHKLHVGTLGLKCEDCHHTDEDGFSMQYPTTDKCMTCHQAIKTDSPHIQKLAKFAESKEPVPWVQLYKVPDFVWFAHTSHVDAGINCQECHGPVAERDAMFKEKSTSMSSCMQCHAAHGAPNACDFCHDPG